MVATRNPANSTVTPIVSVTANAVDAPRRPLSVPLAPSTSVPRAMSTLPIARRRGCAAIPRPRLRSRPSEDAPRGQHRARDDDDRGAARADGREHAGQRAEHLAPGGELGARHRLEQRGRGHHAGGEDGHCRDRDRDPVPGALTPQQVHRAEGEIRDVQDRAEEEEDPKRRARPACGRPQPECG